MSRRKRPRDTNIEGAALAGRPFAFSEPPPIAPVGCANRKGRGFIHRFVAFFSLLLLALPLAAQDQQVPAASEPFVYEVDRTDFGFGDQETDLDTPQALIETIVDGGLDRDWNRVAATLDLSELSEAERAEQGPKLARQTFLILYRSISLDWRGLSDRPDAVDTIASNKDPLAGEARRSVVLGHLRADDRDYSVRIARLQAPGQDPVWMVSRQTVENIPELFEKYGPTRFERSLPDPLRKQAFWTLAWWEVIALPFVVLLAMLAAALTYLAIRRIRNRFDDDSLAYGVLKAIHLPATLLALAGTFALVRQFVFNFSGTINSILDPLQILLIMVAAGAVALTAIETMLDFATDRRTEKLEDPDNENSRDFFTKMSAVRRIITVIVILAGAAIILIATDITQTLGFTLLASAGVLGLILVFAARQILGDIMASVQIAFAKTARIGDAVQYSGQWCYVERIGFTHVRLRTWDERRIMAPVGDFIGSSFENWTKEDPSLMMHVELQFDHRADIDALRERFESFVAGDEDVVDKDDAKVMVIGHSSEAMTVRFLARARDPKIGWDMHCRMREAMLAAASDLDAGTQGKAAPVFLPREREVKMNENQLETHSS